MLKSNELMPLMGMLEKGQQQLSFCSSLYNTPLFQHEVLPLLFLFIYSSLPPIIYSQSRSNRSSTFPLFPRFRELSSPTSQVYEASIRKADTLFLAGKMEPNMRVFQPGDKDYQATMQQLEEYLLQKYIQKREFPKPR